MGRGSSKAGGGGGARSAGGTSTAPKDNREFMNWAASRLDTMSGPEMERAYNVSRQLLDDAQAEQRRLNNEIRLMPSRTKKQKEEVAAKEAEAQRQFNEVRAATVIHFGISNAARQRGLVESITRKTGTRDNRLYAETETTYRWKHNKKNLY